MSQVKSYQDLIAWQKAMELVELVYRSSTKFPTDERFGLTSQLRRAAVSIPSNIAEGQGRMSTGEFVQHLGHARGSLYEVETQVLLSQRLEFMNADQANELRSRIDELSRVLNGLIGSLK